MVELKNVDVHFKDGGGVDALNGVNLRIEDGEFVFIVGDSGAGKSTLLKLLTREIAPTSGRVFVNGYNLAKIKTIRHRVPYVLNLVKLADRAKSYPEKLSGGEKQRVAIARAFASDPKLIIADEPTANIDPALSYDIVKLLKEINKCGTTVIMVTHEHSLVEYFGGRIVSLKNGEVIFDEYVEGEAQDE